MYRIEDKASAVRQVQLYLELTDGNSFSVVPNGIYDDKTKAAVMDYQRGRGLNESGEVDLITFEYLRDEAEKNRRINSCCAHIPLPLRPGHSHHRMIEINAAMAEILDYYRYSHNIRPSFYYSNQTAEGVSALRRIYLLDERDEIDAELYARMSADRKAIDRINNNFA